MRNIKREQEMTRLDSACACACAHAYAYALCTGTERLWQYGEDCPGCCSLVKSMRWLQLVSSLKL